jgi:hypothetical protein
MNSFISTDQKTRCSREGMLKFISTNCPNGFVRKKGHVKTPRVRFEALAVGTALALRKNPNLKVENMDWVNDENDPFHKMATAGSSNSRPKIKRRIEYVRNRLLGVKIDET